MIETLQDKKQNKLKELGKVQEFTRWGKRHKIKDKIAKKEIGDGLQILQVTPLNTRPLSYIVCIDSSTDIFSDDFDLDPEIYELLEDEFGRLNTDSGVTWDSLAIFENEVN